MKIERKEKYLLILLALYLLLLIWSFIKPFDLLLWFYEAAPGIIGTFVLAITYSKLTFTKTTYFWWFIGAYLMTIGAHYSFSEVPLFNWLKDVFEWDRNNYDKLGHVVQGIVPALMVRELLVKRAKLTSVFWLNLMALFVTIGNTAIYEIMEWLSIYIDNRTTGDFLGEQGFRWDAQSDMFMALLGGVLVLLFGRKNMKVLLTSMKAHDKTEQTD